MNNQNNAINLQKCKEDLSELQNYINTKINNKNNNENNSLADSGIELAEQKSIVTDKIEETPLPAIDLNVDVPPTENINPSVEVVATPSPAPEINPAPAPMPSTNEVPNPPLESENIPAITGVNEPAISEAIPNVVPIEQPNENAQVVQVQPQDLSNSVNVVNNPQNTTVIPDVPLTPNDGTSVIAPQLDNVTPAPVVNSTPSTAENPEITNNLEAIPQIDISSVLEEPNQTSAINQDDSGVYKAATNMGAIAINNDSTTNNPAEVTMPIGQEAIPEPTSPIVTEASFNEVPDVMKITA